MNTWYSRGGHVVFIGNGPVVWYSKHQTNVAQSSAEAELWVIFYCVYVMGYMEILKVWKRVKINKEKNMWDHDYNK